MSARYWILYTIKCHYQSVTGELSWCNPSEGRWNFAIYITTYDRVIVSGHPTQIPVDTEEVELQVTVNPTCTTGIYEIPNKGEFSIYPNPSMGIFTVSYQPTAGPLPIIEIYNVLGEKVFTEPLGTAQDEHTIDLRGKPSGIYLYRILNTNGGMLSEGKLLIQK